MHNGNGRNLVVFLTIALATGCAGGAASRSETAVQYTSGGEAGYGNAEAQTTATGMDAEGEASPRASVQYQMNDAGGAGASADMAPPTMAPAQPSVSPGSMAMTRIAPPPPREEVRQQAPEPDPTYRPGLGTEFGEQRTSQISFVQFQRASQQPFATVALNYNDPQGVSAMVSHDMARGAAMAPVGIDPRGELTISIVDEFGRPLSALSVGGRVYIIGAAGQRYSIQVRNNGPRRFEIVASVDGLDVMDGREANLVKRGYIAGPYQSFNIEGFRTSEAQVAAFRFGSVRNSYAARTGSARNVGVIGVALFSEQGVNYWDENEIHLRQQADPFPGRFSQPPQ